MEHEQTNTKIVVGILWLASLVIVGFVSYLVGMNGSSKNVTVQTVVTPTVQPTIEAIISTAEPTVAATDVDLDGTCDITGPSQKKDYLVTYILKEGDSLPIIAERELGDKTRTSEIIQLNDNAPPMTVGGTIYLPPKDIKESSGHIFQTSGKIVKKDTVSWQLSYGGGVKGTGIVFPGYWFKNIPNQDTYKLGDCVTVLFDNGVKVYSVKKN